MISHFDDGGPAFPRPGQQVNFGDGWLPSQDGMTLRDWFAGQALIGMCSIAAADPSLDTLAEMLGKSGSISLSELSFKTADAMIAARGRKEEA